MITFTTKVEIAFNAGFSTPAASRTWTDVSAYLLSEGGISIDYGRQDERETPDANRLRLTLKNSDGRFTPDRSASPYYPNVKAGRPIRVTRTPLGGAASTRFVGFIDEWPVAWPAVVPTFSTVSITASSRMAWLGRRSAGLRSVVETEYLLAEPAAYYTMGDPAGSTTAADSSPNAAPPLRIVGTGANPVFGSATGPGTDGLTAVQFNDGKFLLMDYPPFAGTELWMAAIFLTTSVSGTGDYIVRGGIEEFHFISINADGTIDGKVGATGAATHSTNSYNDGETHHVLVTGGPGGTDLYIDGELVDSNATPVGACTIDGFQVGGERDIFGVGGFTFDGTVSHVAFGFDHLDATVAEGMAAAALTGFADEAPGERIERYARYANIPATELDLDAGTTPITHIDTVGRTPLELMRVVAETDGGVLFDDRDGDLHYEDRSGRYNAAAAITLSVPNNELERDYEPRLDLSSMVNEVIASSLDGLIVVPAVDAASQDDYGPQGYDLQMATDDENEIHAAAWWRVNTLHEPAARVATLSVELAKLSATKAGQALSCNTSSLIAVTGLPSNASSTTAEYFVEGYTENIGPTTHTITFNVSPAAGYDVFTVGDAVLGQYDAYPLAY